MTSGIDHLIINSPFEEPKLYWSRDELIGTFQKVEGRRPAGYVVATPGSRTMDDPGKFIPIPNVDDIRKRVKAWRANGYAGVTGITKRLLEHWNNPEEREGRRFFFCQLEAIETLIWLAEAPASERVGIEIPSDGSAFRRYCAKMATGSGKTVVMAMLIAWQALNKIADPQNPKFSKNILVIAPGLTVKRRLQVLIPSDPTNFYDEFRVVPTGLREKLYQAKVIVQNWHMLNWETAKNLAKKRSVDKRGPKSDNAYVREVLGEMANAQNILVINDEAHHAWRIPEGLKLRGITKEEKDEATIWIGGLDRIHRTRGLLAAYDFSATPFVSIGKKGSEEALFNWIVSDFGLNDAIESGLVKTPRVVIRDDGRLSAERKSRFFHIYPHVKDDLSQKAEEKKPLPDLVKNAYTLLGKDWLETARLWEEQGFPTPPVMITVANTTHTAARIKFAFDRNRFQIEELSDPENVIHIDSKVLAMAEELEIEIEQPVETEEESEEVENEQVIPKLTKKQQAARIREIVDTVGKVGKTGEKVKSVISVGMLSEGWDAKTVTHIMGLRAFNSQLLCEQVVGRGLRRTSYDLNEQGMFDPEYVNIFGVPFTYMPHEDTGIVQPKPPSPKFAVEPVHEKREFEISWPNVLRVEHIFKPKLSLDISKVSVLELDAYETATLAELAPVVDGQPDINRISEINLEELGKKYRTQKIIFETAANIYEQLQADWKDKGNKEYLLAQVIRIVENFIHSDRIIINPPLFNQGDLRKRIIITLNMSKVVQHIWEAIRMNNTESLELVMDTDRPIRSTGDMMTWYTSRPWEYTRKSHINRCVTDSGWETSEAFELDRKSNKNVTAWVKNDHLGFAIYYTYQGTTHTYWPDYLVKLTNGEMLVLEVKGKDDQQNRTKREFLDEWVRAVNQHGGFGQWRWAVSKNPADLKDILSKNNE